MFHSSRLCEEYLEDTATPAPSSCLQARCFVVVQHVAIILPKLIVFRKCRLAWKTQASRGRAVPRGVHVELSYRQRNTTQPVLRPPRRLDPASLWHHRFKRLAAGRGTAHFLDDGHVIDLGGARHTLLPLRVAPAPHIPSVEHPDWAAKLL